MGVREKLAALKGITEEQQEYGTEVLRDLGILYDDGTIEGVNDNIPRMVARIDDSQTSSEYVWSSQKTQLELTNVAANASSALSTAISTEVSDRNTAISTAVGDEATARSESINEITELIPSNASTTNKLATVGDIPGGSSAIMNTESSTSFSLSDAADAPLAGLVVEGRTTNNNLLEVKRVTYTNGSFTFTNNGDGTFTLNGTTSEIERTRIDQLGNSSTENLKNYTQGYYTISGASTKFSVNVLQDQTYTTVWSSSHSVTKTAEMSATSNCFIMLYIPAATSFNNETFRIMFNKGETALPFEPYGINNVGDNGFGVTSCGKNLFDKDNANVFNGFISAPDGRYASNNDYRTIYIKIQPSTTYTVSKIAGKSFRLATSVNYPQSETPITGTVADHTGTSLSITSGSNDHYLACLIWSSANDDTLTFDEIKTTVQAELGSTATAFEPYKGSTASLTTGLPLCSVGDVKDEVDYNKGVVVKRTGKIVLDGTETGWYVDSSSETATSGSKRLKIATLNIPIGVYSTDSAVSSAIADTLAIVSAANTWQGTNDNAISIRGYHPNSGDDYTEIGVRILGISTIEALTAYLTSSPVTVVYELAEPYEIPLTSTELAAYRNLRTFEGTTNITATNSPAMTVDYLLDTDNGKAVGKVTENINGQLNLQQLQLNDHEQRIADLEDAMTQMLVGG